MTQADDNRIKYDNTNKACSYYLRSPHAINASTANNASITARIQMVNAAGSIAAGYCDYNSCYLAPCCCVV
jgi:hypothetical protein